MAKNNTVEKRNSILGMSFFGPALVLMAIFLFIPMILTLVFIFTDYLALNPSLTSFVGLDNYVALFKDRLFVQAFGNTILFVIIIVPLQMGLAFGLALFIDKISYCKTYFKISFFLHQIKKEGLIFDSILFNPLLTIKTFIITVAIVF